ncbi:unnamed protein product [Angiostrongylus costaricensis]|uniref:ATP synthase subunit s, mitochondrial n=1 Tax=Angiostrongylus costaricensis TaxID=334426 RepID=A0A0R3PBK9_ANGCS|nr:unnamed protein product [Angiostrongylus costaricensis]
MKGVFTLKIYSLRRRIAERLSNRFNEKRINEIGPDLACLEWLMECGSTEIDASDSAIANEGFKYFRDLRHLEVLKMNFCDYFDDDAIRELALGRPAATLRDIEIVLNPSVSDGAVYWLSRLTALRRAHFYFLPYVSNRQWFIRQLKLALPRSEVILFSRNS